MGLARTMRARSTQLSRSFALVFHTPGNGRRRRPHVQRVDRGGARAGVLRRAGREVRQAAARSSRCGSADSFGTARRQHGDRPPISFEPCLEGAGIAFLFAQVFHLSRSHAARDAEGAGVKTAFNLPRPAVRIPRARRASCAACRSRSSLSWLRGRWPPLSNGGSCPRRGRPGRDLDDRLHEGVGMPRRCGQHVPPSSWRRGAL